MDLASPKASIKKSGIFLVSAIAFWILVLLFPFSAHAASLYIDPGTKNVTVGQTFTLSAYVSSLDQAMNAASGDISFPSNKLQVLAISKANSIISLWVRDPSFTNSVTGGDINFQGIVLNPGFTGSAGDLITITFQAVGVGDATIAFSSGAVLANNGSGTNILNSLESADITIGPRVVTAPSITPSGTSRKPTSTALVQNASTTSTTTVITTSSPAIGVGYSQPSNIWQNLTEAVAEWELLILLALLLLAAILVLILYLIHRIRKWRITSARDLLGLEEMLRNDLKRLDKQLGPETVSNTNAMHEAIKNIEGDIKKDISAIEDIKEKY